MSWLKSLTITGKLIAAAVAIVLLVAAFLAVRALFVGGLKTEVKLRDNQAQAAQQSGADAVNTVAKAADREAAGDTLTRSNEQEIHSAQGADVKVASPVNDAGLQALCRRVAYANSARCVRLRDSRANSR